MNYRIRVRKIFSYLFHYLVILLNSVQFKYFTSIIMLSNSSAHSSGAVKGGEWKKTLYFTLDPKNPLFYPIEVKNYIIKSYFATVEGNEEYIEKVEMFKNRLSPWLPIFAGLWHEFAVVKSTNWYWSFEKNSKGICVQRGKTAESVKDYCFGNARTYYKSEGRPAQYLHNGDTIQQIFIWIFEIDYLIKPYHITRSNCHFFATILFGTIVRTKGRHL